MSVPFTHEPMTLRQPDGSAVSVTASGNQHYAEIQTLDGYSLVQDPASGAWEYAALSPDGLDLRPTGVVPAEGARVDLARARLDLAPGLRVDRRAAQAKALSPYFGLPVGRERWRQRREEERRSRFAATGPNSTIAPPQRQTVGDYVGLCILVDFPDVPARITDDEVEAFCNKPGYSGFGNAGSVFDYFKDVSSGKLRFRTNVTPYYRARRPRAYYTDERVPQPIRARELISEALDHLVARGFDFTRLSKDGLGHLQVLSVLCAGPETNTWSRGLSAHGHHLETAKGLPSNVFAHDYQIACIGDELSLGRYCHETAHMLCDFPDLFDHGNQSSGCGVYCLMGAGATASPKNPPIINAYLRRSAGWSVPVAIEGGINRVTTELDTVLIHQRSATEYFLIENRFAKGRDASLPSSGLAIWHVDERGSNDQEQMTPARHYECALVQADAQHHLERNLDQGSVDDLFAAPSATSFGAGSAPNSQWWNKSRSSLEIMDISAPGRTMTFDAVGRRSREGTYSSVSGTRLREDIDAADECRSSIRELR